MPVAVGNSPEPKRTTESLEKIRQAVVDKNFYWFNRYRTTDGYSVFGDRADLKFVAGQTNRVVMQREMEILDQLTANRDPAVWAAAQGKTYKVNDADLSPFIPVVSNKKGNPVINKETRAGNSQVKIEISRVPTIPIVVNNGLTIQIRVIRKIKADQFAALQRMHPAAED